MSSRQSSTGFSASAMSPGFLQHFQTELPVHISEFLTSDNTSNFHTLLFKKTNQNKTKSRDENATALIIRDNSNCPRTQKLQRLISCTYLKRKWRAADSGGGCAGGTQCQRVLSAGLRQHGHTTEGCEACNPTPEDTGLLQESAKPKRSRTPGSSAETQATKAAVREKIS